ncbi:zinc finger protein 423 [Aplysia californica]|uniref:Zinc finger protein 423 n=1 Tax=Aplysia californica TaxID=6500 RepID=A0ABM0JLF2_APLCA|nr:zinc finger protein 423 [Aplysia californica]
MSRRKQARPKSCKSEEFDDLARDSVDTLMVSTDHSLTESGILENSGGADAKTGAGAREENVPKAVSPATNVTPGPRVHHDVISDTPDPAKAMKCEVCGAKFESLRLFLEHQNLECGVAAESKANWLWTENTSLPSMSPSSQSTSSVDAAGAGGVGEAELLEMDGMDPTQVPYVIGVNDDHPHNCRFCEKAFSKLGHLRLHEQTHAAHMPYKCQHCPRLFRHKKSRERHEKLHSSDRKYKCQTCGVGYSRSDHLRNHMKSHDLMENDEGFKCPVCLQNYMSASALTNHLKTHKLKYPSEEGEDLGCFKCKKSFPTSEELQQHLLTHAEVSAVKVEKFVCEICQEIFFSQDLLDLHSRSEHSSDASIKCPICFEDFTDTELLCQHIMAHNSGPVSSQENSVLDLADSNLVSQGSTVNEAPSVVRTPGADCDGTVGLPEEANQPEMLVCPYCLTDGFESLESLELHLTSVHSVKPTEVYTCNYCNAPYPNLYSLHDHMTVVHRSQHGLDITYPCSMCVQRFHSLDALAKHKGIVHAQQRSNGIDAAFCNRCNMTLASPRTLEDHMITVHNIVMDRKALKGKGKKSSGKSSKDGSTASSRSSLENGSRGASKSSGATKSLPSFLMADDGQPKAKYPKTSSAGRILDLTNAVDRRKSISPGDIKCDQCNISFHDQQSYDSHMALHAEASLSLSLLANGACEPPKLKEESEVNGGSNQSQSAASKVHECFKCGASFSTEEQLEAHASLHYLCVSTEYGCSNCVKNFSKPDELQKHLMDIHAHHLYRCSLCKDIFDSKVNIQVHFAIKHSNECKLYKCVSCDIMFRSEMEWQVHVRVNHLHMSRPYRCLFCQESFTSEVELQCHLTTHSKQFTCPMCDQAFHIEYLLDQHMQSCHTDIKPDMAQKSSPRKQKHHGLSVSPARDVVVKQENIEPVSSYNSIPSSSSSSSSSSSCSPRIILKSPSAPSPHRQYTSVLANTPVPSPLPLPSPISNTPVSSIWKSTEPLHMCNICDVKFSDLVLLNIHKAEDHGLKSAGKTGCTENDADQKTSHEKLLLNNQTLLSALTSPVSSEVTSSASTSLALPSPTSHFSCMFCSQTFKTSLEYNKHMKIHVNSGNLTCSICDETFVSPSVLAEHKLTHCKIHQGNTCVVCRVALTSQEQFYIHAQEHGFEGSLLQCVVCRQTLSSLVELQMHGRHHFQTRPSFFTCCVCLKSFESKENLVSKLNSSGRTYYVCKPCYHGEAPLHTCSQCSEKFATAQLLETHMLTHKANFQCIKCQQSFSTEYEIQLHVASHMLTEGTQHECRLCGALFDSPGRLQTHLIQHSFVGRDIVCFVCNKTFESPQEIQVHALEHNASFKKFACSHCSQKFFFSAEYENHKLIYGHGADPFSSMHQASPLLSASLLSSSAAMSMASLASFLSSSSPLTKAQELSPSLSLTNKRLLERFQDVKAYDLSKKSGHSPSASKRQDPLLVPSLTAAPASLECPECHKYFSTGTALANHRKTHLKKDGSPAIRCSLCSETFNSALAMQQHFFTVHSSAEEHRKKKSFKCMMCDKECSTLSALQNHILSHRAGSSLPCDICKKTFTSQRYLNLHMRVHKQGDKKKLDDKNGAEDKMHVEKELSVPEVEGRGDLNCPVCGENFASTQEIESHLKTHKEVYTTSGSADFIDSSGEDQTVSHTEDIYNGAADA